MARQPRLAPGGMALHVIQRGNNRMVCYRVESDFLLYLSTLRELSAKYRCAVHAYCLMTNHVHLLMTQQEESGCASLMKNLSQRYAQYFNSRYGRTGTLWEGRYRSSLVASARYVLACYRYIELNPVRAKLVSHPSAWLWSSYAVNSGARTDPWVAQHPEFESLAADSEARAAAYCAIVRDSIDQQLLNEIRERTNGGYPLVPAETAAALEIEARRMAPGRAGRPPKKIGT